MTSKTLINLTRMSKIFQPISGLSDTGEKTELSQSHKVLFSFSLILYKN